MEKKLFGIKLKNSKKTVFLESQFNSEIEKKWGYFRLNTSQKFVRSIQ